MESVLDFFYQYAEGITFVLLSLLSIFLLISRRIKARLEVAAPAPRLLPQLAQAASVGKPNKARETSVRLLKKADWVLYDKLKLFPDVNTEHRLSLLWMLFAAWLVVSFWKVLIKNEFVMSFWGKRAARMELAQQARPGLWIGFLLVILCSFLTMLPFFLTRRNREFYFDVLALFALFEFAMHRMFVCRVDECCFGIPWPWGFHNRTLNTTVFPVEPFEAGLQFLFFILCILYMLYAKTYRPGRACSFCLFSYAAPRFFWDYLRYRGEWHRYTEINGLFGLTMVQTLCIGLVLLSVAWLFLLPLEKKLMDKLLLFATIALQKLAVKIYFHPWFHPLLSKHLAWCQNVVAMEEMRSV